uniref:DUF4203 domain-containing protein n=1 Tax=Cuerna arida TaxID=1464854 RepID=A0A1B6F628_9HEMI
MSSAAAVLFLLLYSFVGCDPQSVQDIGPTTEFQLLQEDEVYYCCASDVSRDLPAVYCYKGFPKEIFHTWRAVSVSIDLPAEQYDLYEGVDSREVMGRFEARSSSWHWNTFWNSEQKSYISLDPFNSTCFGIKTLNDYTIKLEAVQVNYLRLAIFSLGLSLFFLSPLLASSSIFYYFTGTCVGTTLSILVFIYLFLKLLPLKRSVIYGMVVGGSSLTFFFFKAFSIQVVAILVSNHQYVFAYLSLSAIISFIVCYRIGPMTDPRSRNLVKWFLQLIALTVIFYSSHLREFTVAVDMLLLCEAFLHDTKCARWLQNVLFGDPNTQVVIKKDNRRTQEYTEYQKCIQWQEFCQKMIAGERQYVLIDERVKPITNMWDDDDSDSD